MGKEDQAARLEALPQARPETPVNPEHLIVDAQALQNLVNFVAQAPLPMGRDALVQAVVESARPAQVQEEG